MKGLPKWGNHPRKKPWVSAELLQKGSQMGPHGHESMNNLNF